MRPHQHFEVDSQLGSEADIDGIMEPEPPTTDAEVDDLQPDGDEEFEEVEQEAAVTNEAEAVYTHGPDAVEEDAEPAQAQDDSKPKRKKESVLLKHEPGKSLFPVSRVQKILKRDEDLPIVSKEAVFLISRATEEFIARIAQASRLNAIKEHRTTVQRRDTALAVRRADEFWFLEEIIPWHDPEAEQRRKPKALQKDDDDETRPKTMLDQFVMRKNANGDPLAGVEDATMGDEDVVMNEDGTMSMAPDVPVGGLSS